MYTGVSGIQSFQQQMDVIGNNIANVNTVGYRSQRVDFAEVLSQTIAGATAPSESYGGGTNPMQTGLGVGVSAITTINTRGSMQMTGNSTDLAIDGDGYFIVQDAGSDTFMFTRAGNFGVDAEGNLVTADGLYVCGWQEYDILPDGSYELNTTREPEPINLFTDQYISPQATENVVLSGILNSTESASGTSIDTIGTSSDSPDYTMPFTVTDSLGSEYEVGIEFTKCYVDDSDADNPVTSWYWEIPSENGSTFASGYIKFDSNGEIVSESGFETNVDVEFTPDSSTGTSPFTVTIDFESISMYDSESSVEPFTVDGYQQGELADFTIGADGTITGVYSNGQQQPLGTISLANFTNPAGLQNMGGNLFRETPNSGDFTLAYQPGTEGVGALNPQYLEMSNVDLSRQLTDMIIAQRGFQANSKIITTSDEMLKELINLKR